MEQTDVIVVGAGAAGLSCARKLAGAGVGVLVVESRDRVGGRIKTLRLPGEDPIELGAQVVHGRRTCTWDTLRDAGLTARPLPAASEFLFAVQGERWSLGDLLGRGVAPPWVVEQWLEQRHGSEDSAADVLDRLARTPVERDVCKEWLTQIWCADPKELGAAGVADTRAQRRADPDDFVVVEGYDAVTRELATGLDVRLAAPARSIAWGDGRVEIRADEMCVRARAAVVTVPPQLVAGGAVAFDPALPDVKLDAARKVASGDALVLVVALRTPAPLSAWAIVGGPHGGLWQATAGSRVVRGWIKGSAAARVRAARLADRDPISLVRPALPWAAGDSVDDVYVADWGRDPFSRGGYWYPRAGAGDTPQRWAAPLARTLFFAGDTACSRRDAGRVHGAIASGRRAAADVLAALAGRP